MRKWWMLLLLTLTVNTNSLWAAPVFDFNPTCQKAYKELVQLRIAEGETLLAEARAQNSENLIVDYLEGYVHFFILFFNENPSEYSWRKARFEAIIEKLADGPTNTPWYLYTRSVVHLQKAVVAIKFSERWSAGWDLRKAFMLVKDNRKKYPAFVPNDLIYGPVQVAAGVIPDGYKWLASLFGLKGSVKTGMNIMRNLVDTKDAWGKFYQEEANFYYCYLQFYVENKQQETIRYIQQRQLDVVNNHLYAYLASNLGINSKNTDYARTVITKRNPSTEYLSTPVWDFEMGFVRLHHLEYAEAAKHYDSFLRHFKGKFYVKDAAQKLSWCYYLQGNMQAANAARQWVLTKGGTDTDADKKAYKDAKTGKWPHPLLLKARLLNDGGYNKDAITLLHGKTANDFESEAEQLEFVYRVARIYDELGKDEEAIQFYLKAIQLGEHRTEYFAARAALQLGMLYEAKGNKELAIQYFERCIAMNDHEYKDSLDQRAKSGIARCKGL
ncbi:MAG TPA: hypothetical protein DCL43_13600 [Chitinophagaceae bacterium]|nr:hypothetical protein [Chitinophagaceae bacterium]HAN37511.1 hypothetical protein [Chitinophagaceae bacterium]